LRAKPHVIIDTALNAAQDLSHWLPAPGAVHRTKTEVGMNSVHRARFWIEISTASFCGMLALLTVFWRDWIEALTGFDPDQHNGSFEWAIVVALLLVSAVVGSFARAEWRRLQAPFPTAG